MFGVLPWDFPLETTKEFVEKLQSLEVPAQMVLLEGARVDW